MYKWKTKKFNELTTRELYEIFKTRMEVFVVEQKCAYPEIDPYDLQSLHFFAQDEVGGIVAYCRIIMEPENIRIGRVLVDSKYRKQNMGKQLLEKAIQSIKCRYPNKPLIKIQAQAYLEKFYHDFGFQNQSECYLEDGIPHIDMQLMLEPNDEL